MCQRSLFIISFKVLRWKLTRAWQKIGGAHTYSFRLTAVFPPLFGK